MTLTEFQERVNVVIGDILTNQLPDFMLMTINQDIIADVTTRLQDNGELSNGKKPTYSTKPSLVGYPPADSLPGYADMYNKAYKKLKADKSTKWVTIKKGNKNCKLMVNEGGYKWMKENIQERTGIVDFTVSGNMLRSVKVKGGVKINGAKLTVVYGPNGSEEEKKIGALSEKSRFGGGVNILMPNAEEILALKKRVEKQIIKYLNAGLFGK